MHDNDTNNLSSPDLNSGPIQDVDSSSSSNNFIILIACAIGVGLIAVVGLYAYSSSVQPVKGQSGSSPSVQQVNDQSGSSPSVQPVKGQSGPSPSVQQPVKGQSGPNPSVLNKLSFLRFGNHNYGGLQSSNPFEFEGTTEEYQYDNILGKVAEGMDKTIKDVFGDQKDAILKACGFNDSEIKEITGDTAKTFKQLFEENSYGQMSRIDKACRKAGAVRYTLTQTAGQGNEDSLSNVRSVDVDVNEDCKQWDQCFTAAEKAHTEIAKGKVKGSNGSVLNDDDYANAKKALQLQDIAIIAILRRENLLEDALAWRKEFAECCLGNPEQKAEILAKKYFESGDILTLQEVDSHIKKNLEANGYKLVGKNDSLVAYNKNVWKESDEQPKLPSDKTDSKNTTVVVQLQKVKNENVKLVAVSSHADSKGSNTIEIADALCTLLGENQWKDVPVVIGVDANTQAAIISYSCSWRWEIKQNVTEITGKADLDKYKNLMENGGYVHVFCEEVPTKNSTRTYLQTQISKAGVQCRNKSDWIWTRGITRHEAGFVFPGPVVTNPSDHIYQYMKGDIRLNNPVVDEDKEINPLPSQVQGGKDV